MLKGTSLDSLGLARSHGVLLSADRSTGSAISIAEMGRRSAMLPRTSTAGAGSSARTEDAEWAGWDSKVDGGVALNSVSEITVLGVVGFTRPRGTLPGIARTFPLTQW